MTPYALLLLALSALPIQRAATPTFQPDGGSAPASVAVATTSTGAVTFCTTDGSTPRRSASLRYSAPIAIPSATTTLRCQTYRAGRRPSLVKVATYTYTPPPGPGLCASETMRASGVKYYYCECGTGANANCVAGNNAWDGLTPSTPKQTGYQARFNTMAAGSTVALCRGGSFPGETYGMHSSMVKNSNCLASNTCDLRDYADPRFTPSGSEVRPIIRGQVGGWLGDADHYEGFRFFNLQVRMGANVGFNADMNVTDVDMCNILFDAGGAEGTFAVYWADEAGGASGPPQRHTFRQNQTQNTGGGILGGCTDCVLDNNYFANTSYSPNSNRDHPLYITCNPVNNMRITNNEIHGCPPGGSYGTVLFVVHGHHTNLLIENNLVQCDNPGTLGDTGGGNYGIALDNGAYTDSAQATYAYSVIRRNWVVNNGDYGIALAQAPYSLVEDNVIIMPPSEGGYHGIGLGHVPDRGPPNNDTPNTNITVRNNTVYSTSAGDYGVQVGSVGNTYVVTGNAFYLASGGDCFQLGLTSGAYQNLDRNACRGTIGSAWPTNTVTLTSSPFVSAPTDFTPAVGSPIVAAASTASTCTVKNMTGQSCSSGVAANATAWSPADTAKTRVHAPTDIGAYER
jgi:hypothetical protein